MRLILSVVGNTFAGEDSLPTSVNINIKLFWIFDKSFLISIYLGLFPWEIQNVESCLDYVFYICVGEIFFEKFKLE
jgi:hypothetical protein